MTISFWIEKKRRWLETLIVSLSSRKENWSLIYVPCVEHANDISYVNTEKEMNKNTILLNKHKKF